MNNWIICQYYGTADLGNKVVNLSLVATFYKTDEYDGIWFSFGGKDGVSWEFENTETRDMEYDRLLTIIASNIQTPVG